METISLRFQTVHKDDLGALASDNIIIYGIYIAFTTLCGGLCQTAYLGANCSHAAHNLIRENSRVPRCPQHRICGKTSHHDYSTYFKNMFQQNLE